MKSTAESPKYGSVEFDKKQWKAYGTNCWIKRLVRKSMKGLILTENSNERSLFARLISKGNGMFHQKGFFELSTAANEGDIVMIRQFAGRDYAKYRISVGDKAVSSNSDYRLVSSNEIEGVYEKTPWPQVPGSTQSIRMLLDHMIIKRDEPNEKVGSFFVPELSKQDKMTGIVIAIGPGWWNHNTGNYQKTEIKVGQRVLFNKYGGYTMELDGQKYMVFREFDMYGISDTEIAPDFINSTQHRSATFDSN